MGANAACDCPAVGDCGVGGREPNSGALHRSLLVVERGVLIAEGGVPLGRLGGLARTRTRQAMDPGFVLAMGRGKQVRQYHWR